jgi:hypothetical protein
VKLNEGIELIPPLNSVVRSDSITTSLHLLHMCLSSACHGKYKLLHEELNMINENHTRNSIFVFDTLTTIETLQPTIPVYSKKRKLFQGTVSMTEI